MYRKITGEEVESKAKDRGVTLTSRLKLLVKMRISAAMRVILHKNVYNKPSQQRHRDRM